MACEHPAESVREKGKVLAWTLWIKVSITYFRTRRRRRQGRPSRKGGSRFWVLPQSAEFSTHCAARLQPHSLAGAATTTTKHPGQCTSFFSYVNLPWNFIFINFTILQYFLSFDFNFFKRFIICQYPFATKFIFFSHIL